MTHTPYTETQVNTYTTGDQLPSAVLALDDGGWVVTWESQGQDRLDFPDGYGVYQQAYNADGTVRGEETLVNTGFTTGDQHFNSITALSDGGWVVTYESASHGHDPSGTGIFQQRYHADGTTFGSEVLVNNFTTGDQKHSVSTALADGGWVVAWEGPDYPTGDGNGIYQQRYDATGAIVGHEVHVNSYATGEQFDPHITVLAGGGWVVEWISQNQDGSRQGVYQQLYDADGAASGGETRVNTYTADDQGGNVFLTALSGGGWTVTWMSNDQDGSSQGIYQQAYSADGSTTGDETRVNTYTSNMQFISTGATTALQSGGWVVTWFSDGEDGDISGVYQQAYKSDGTVLGGETQVNTYTTDAQLGSSVTALADGGWVNVWESRNQDGDSYGIYQQAYNADGTARGDEMRVNTTTAGNQGDACVTALADGGWLVAWYSNQTGSYDAYQQRYDAEGQIYGTNHAPTAADSTVSDLENSAYAFSASTFGFSDGTDGDSLASVVITGLPSAGKLLLDGHAVTEGEQVGAADLSSLVWQAGKHALAGEIRFKVVDDGGTETGGKDTSSVHMLNFAITSDTFAGTMAAEKLVGTDGHDILIGNGGNDTLKGGAAGDSFVFATGDGKDKVTDFHSDQGDTLDLSAVDGIASYKDLIRHHISEHESDLWIIDDAGDRIILKHTSALDLHKGDFVF